MKAVFIELPAFERHRTEYLNDDAFAGLQTAMMKQPVSGDLIQDAGGLRKLRLRDARRGKGKRGGLRVIYFWLPVACEFWLFTIYDKDEMTDLTPRQRRMLKLMLKAELEARRT